MKYILSLIVLLSFSALHAQNFEGEIMYNVSYTVKKPGFTSEQLQKTLGTTKRYFIKNGDYKSVTNGTGNAFQLYVSKENKVYTKFGTTNVYLWEDARYNADKVTKTELNKNVTQVLDYKCDEVILTTTAGMQHYYYSDNFKVDTAAFINAKFGNWYDFVSKSGALPLKIIVETEYYTMEATAVKVEAKKLTIEEFTLPADAKVQQNTF